MTLGLSRDDADGCGRPRCGSLEVKQNSTQMNANARGFTRMNMGRCFRVPTRVRSCMLCREATRRAQDHLRVSAGICVHLR